MQYAHIIVDITAAKLDRTFVYRVPENLADKVQIGSVVEVPFGRGNRSMRGYVTGLSDTCALDEEQIKEIRGISDKDVGPEARMVGLAAWMKERYGSTMIAALRTVVPVKQKIRAKETKMLVLTADGEAASKALEQFQKKHQSARSRLLEALIKDTQLPMSLAADKLHTTTRTAQFLEEMGLIEIRTSTSYRNPVRSQELAPSQITLGSAQAEAVERICRDWDDPKKDRRYLLQGVTGSGKTEVYLELIARAIGRGKAAIVLIPEIALTYQTVMRFYRRFGDRVSIVNSRLSQGERFDQFQRAMRGEIDVMIGPRSALFTPFPNLGIIVIDEEHETSYRSETSPRYHAREVAFYRGKTEGAVVVLGSATPSLEARTMCERGTMTRLFLGERAGGAILPQVQIVDMRKELQEGNRSIISRPLRDLMDRTLEQKRQIMLFLNRRGYAGFVSCRSCGHVVKCPHCDVSLTLHGKRRMVCHYCGYEEEASAQCPVCQSPHLGIFRAGTEQIEEELHRLFPDAKTLRMDLDTTREKESYARILSAFADHEADILIGTQMIVKGHDFPLVTLVGILAADLSLHVPDFRSAERTFSLLTQAAGRAGRRLEAGNVVIQTYDPSHYSITCAANQDYEAFYRQEMDYREMAAYPPAGQLLAIHIAGEDEAYLDIACSYLQKFLRRAIGSRPVEMMGPAGETVAKIQDIFRRIIYLKAEDLDMLIDIRKKCEQYIEINEGFCALRVSYELFD
ncbi:MAG: primosomal protein N' [Lachnospiraceae bacterium]|nr:primosomal protein N' [Lachnospiraceae bacterium]